MINILIFIKYVIEIIINIIYHINHINNMNYHLMLRINMSILAMYSYDIIFIIISYNNYVICQEK